MLNIRARYLEMCLDFTKILAYIGDKHCNEIWLGFLTKYRNTAAVLFLVVSAVHSVPFECSIAVMFLYGYDAHMHSR